MLSAGSPSRVISRKIFEAVRTRLAWKEKRLLAQFDQTRSKFFEDYWLQVAQQTGASIESIGYEFYRLKKEGMETYVRRGEVMLDDHLTLNMAGNKPLVHRLLKERGFNVPAYLEYDLDNLNRAFDFMTSLGGNFVVKPAKGGSGGQGITTKVNSLERLKKASFKASIYSSNAKLVIEQELSGDNYRLLYLNGELIDAIKRESPGVVGDGKSTIKSLIRQENSQRLESRSALSPLTIDLDLKSTLEDKGMSLSSVPESGAEVKVKTATNQYSRRENHSVMGEIHPSIIEYGKNISGVINVEFSGVDLMISNHSLPLEDSGCVVNEINTTPGLHHHALISDTSQETRVGSIVLDYIFEKMKSNS